MKNSHIRDLISLVSQAKRKVSIISPWIKGDLLERILSNVKGDVRIEVVLKVSETQDLKITDLRTFRVARNFNAQLYINPKLHAKIIMVDDEKALIGSANVTYGGMEENLEFLTYAPNVKEVIQTYREVINQSTRLDDSANIVVYQKLDGGLLKGVLLESLPLYSFVKIPTDRGYLLCRVVSEYTQDIHLQPEFCKDKLLITSFLYAKTRELGEITNVLIKPLVEYIHELEERSSKISPPIYPLKLPAQAFSAKDEQIFRTNMAGYPMSIPVECGKIVASESKAFIDMSKVCSMHMAVLGSTGSGKTTFVSKVVENLQSQEIKVFIFDVYGEYREKISSKDVEHVSFPNTVFPINAEDLKELFKNEGINIQERSIQEREFFSLMRRYLKPDLKFIAYNGKSLEEVLKIRSFPEIKDATEDLLSLLSYYNGEEAIKNQPHVCELINKGMSSEKQVTIFDLKDILTLDSRINVVGLALREIFKTSKCSIQKRLIVLEEVHHFAPERGMDHTSVDKLSFQVIRQIALEGRKFALGLVAVTQRPANLSKFVLSQMNTQAVFRLITKNDIDAVSSFFGLYEQDYSNFIPYLRTGSFYLTGVAVAFPMMCSLDL